MSALLHDLKWHALIHLVWCILIQAGTCQNDMLILVATRSFFLNYVLIKVKLYIPLSSMLQIYTMNHLH